TAGCAASGFDRLPRNPGAAARWHQPDRSALEPLYGCSEYENAAFGRRIRTRSSARPAIAAAASADLNKAAPLGCGNDGRMSSIGTWKRRPRLATGPPRPANG